MSAQVIYNGYAYGAASVTISLDGADFVGVRSLNIKDSVATGTAMGNSQVGLGRVKGPYTATLDFEIIRHESKLFRARLGQPMSAKAFNVGAYAFENPGAGMDRIEVRGVTVQDIEAGMTQGSDALVDKYTCHVFLPIRWNGQSLVTDPGDVGTEIAASISL